jgi:chromosome partitioning protein
MAEIIAIVNNKGGVGKTTTAINISACLASLGWKTLLMDADQQGSSTIGLGLNKQKLKTTFYDFLMTDTPLEQAVQETMLSGLYILPAKDDLLGVDHKIMALPNQDTILRHMIERKIADPGRAGYDFIIIDAPPNLDILNINIMAAANRLIIPIQPEYLSLEGLANLIDTYKRVRETINPKLSILGILITMNTANCKLSREVSQDLRRFMGAVVFENVIPRNISLAEAPGYAQPIIVYDRKSAGSLSYQAVTNEIIARINLKRGPDDQEK